MHIFVYYRYYNFYNNNNDDNDIFRKKFFLIVK